MCNVSLLASTIRPQQDDEILPMGSIRPADKPGVPRTLPNSGPWSMMPGERPTQLRGIPW